MLEGMRAASKNWLGRSIMAVVMGFIILSFAVWGIGDIFKNFGSNKLAEVGGTEISSDTYRNAYQTELQRLQRQARRAITNDQARAFGLDRQVLARLVQEAALDQNVKNLGLALADADMAKAIIADPAFKGATGNFDKMRFDEILRDNGFNERSFVREQRNVYLRQQITESVAGAVTTPRAMLDAIHRYQSETRSVEYVILPTASVGDVGAAPAEALQKFYEDRRSNFRSPEYRKLIMLALTPSSAAKPESISDADAQKRYDEVKTARYGTPEKRQIQQITFPNEAEAEKASAAIKGGKTFAAVMSERTLAEKDIDLGTIAKTGLADPIIADAAFALASGATSAPVKGQFGSVLLHVVKIIPEAIKPFAEVSAELKKEIGAERAKSEITKVHDAVEDQRASGKPLTEAAKAAGLEVRVIESIDAGGRDRAGKPVDGLVEAATTLKAAFASDIGVDNETLVTKDNGYVWFEVAAIDSARERKLDEVKAEVEAAWREDETAKRLSAKAGDMVKKLQSGTKLDELAKAEGKLEVKLANDVKRGGATDMPTAALVPIFNVGVGGAGSASVPTGRLVFHVLDSVVPERVEDKPEAKALADQVKTALSEDILSQYVGKLQADLGVKVNDAALRAATGAASDQN